MSYLMKAFVNVKKTGPKRPVENEQFALLRS
jgi:hypothetical protein